MWRLTGERWIHACDRTSNFIRWPWPPSRLIWRHESAIQPQLGFLFSRLLSTNNRASGACLHRCSEIRNRYSFVHFGVRILALEMTAQVITQKNTFHVVEQNFWWTIFWPGTPPSGVIDRNVRNFAKKAKSILQARSCCIQHGVAPLYLGPMSRVADHQAWTTVLVRHKPPRGAFCQTSDRRQPDVCCCWTYCLEQSAGGGHFSWTLATFHRHLKTHLFAK